MGETLDLIGKQMGMRPEEAEIARAVRKVVVEGHQSLAIIGADGAQPEPQRPVGGDELALESRWVPLRRAGPLADV